MFRHISRVCASSLIVIGLISSAAAAAQDEISVTGTYLQGFECGVIAIDDNGGSFALLGEYPADGLETGDRIHVTGVIDDTCFDDIPPLIATCGLSCIVASSIDPIVELCGQIQVGPQSCQTINGGDEGYIIGDGLQGATLWDFVRVTGVLVPESQSCFPVVTTTLTITTIDPCVDGDVTRDGHVGVDDVIGVIMAWATDDYWADVSRNGVVDVDDLIGVITHYGDSM